MSFLIKAVNDILLTPINLPIGGLTTSDHCRACGKTASLKHIFTRCEYALRSYTLRHDEVLQIFAETAKVCCEPTNKVLKNITNRAIHFVKESSLLDSCTNWHVATDLEHNFLFPTEVALTTSRPDIDIWSVNLKKVRY